MAEGVKGIIVEGPDGSFAMKSTFSGADGCVEVIVGPDGMPIKQDDGSVLLTNFEDPNNVGNPPNKLSVPFDETAATLFAAADELYGTNYTERIKPIMGDIGRIAGGMPEIGIDPATLQPPQDLGPAA